MVTLHSVSKNSHLVYTHASPRWNPQINLKTVLLEEGVDLNQLAQKMKGYSGADVTNVCRDAAMMPMRRRIKGLKREEIKNLNEKVEDLPVSQADLLEALSRVNSSVSSEDIAKHKQWLADFGST